MIKHIQSFCKSIGDNGCYLFCLFNIAEQVTGKHFDIFEKSEYFIDRGWIKFNWKNYSDDDNFFVLNPVKILQNLTGLTWSVRKEGETYKPVKDDFYVEFWSINGKSGHFARLMNNFNSLQFSKNVEYGEVKSFRVFNIVR